MTAQRVKGQEITITLVRDGVVEDTLTDIQNFNWSYNSEVKSEGYLGETTERKDDIFNGIKFDFEMHTHSKDWLTFARAVINRQRRKTPDMEINISITYFYPNGDTPIVTFPDAKFGENASSVGSRGDYAKTKIQGECDDCDENLSG